MAEDKGKKEEEKTADAPAEGEAEAAEAAKKKKKKKLIIIVAAVVVLLGVGGAVVTLTGGKKDEHAKDASAAHELANDPCLHPASGGGKKKEEAVDPCKPVYVDVPDLIVNLTSDSRRAHFVNLKLTLELKNAEASADVEANMPRLIDSFNIYLREMTKEDLQGTEGLIRLEDEMMLRINKILKPGQVTDILFKSVIVQ